GLRQPPRLERERRAEPRRQPGQRAVPPAVLRPRELVGRLGEATILHQRDRQPQARVGVVLRQLAQDARGRGGPVDAEFVGGQGRLGAEVDGGGARAGAGYDDDDDESRAVTDWDGDSARSQSPAPLWADLPWA